MAVTTKKIFNAVGSGGQSSTTVFTPVSIELNNQDDLDVYVKLSGGTRVLQYRQSTGSTTDSNHPQVNDTTGLYFPAQSAGVTLYNYTLSTDNNTITFNSALPTGAVVSIERRTRDSSSDYTNFVGGSTIRHTDINKAFDEANFTAQEARNKAFDLENAILQGNPPTIDGVPQPFVTSTSIIDGTIVNADVNASAAIAGTKVSPAFGSQNVSTSGTLAAGATTVTGNIAVSGTVDGRDVAADGTKLDGIEASATADQTNAEIRAAVEAASDSNVFTDADHSKLNAIEASATADQTNAEIRAAVEAASDSNVFTDADHTKLNGIEASATADQTVSEIKSLIAGSPLDASHLAADSVTTSEIADAELTTLAGMQTGTASILAGGTALTATLAEINTVVDGKSVETTISDTDAAYPTSGAVVDYVAAQIAPLGGLEVVATEVAFPNTQPASGVVISISDAGGVVFNGSGVSTTGRTVGGSTVTINGAPSSLYSETLVAGVGLLVSSTGSSQTYNYHKILGKEDDIKQLSDDINDFNARYRVNAGEPTSNNDEGDLCYDTNADKMKVYDSSTSAWKEVTSTGDFKYLFLCPAGGSGAPTLNGSIATYDLRESSNSGSAASITSAAQLLVSINGVVQKANTGTSAPAEGFALVDANTIVFGANLASGDSVFIVQFGSALTVTTPGDNTVAEAKLQTNSVSEEKLKVSNSPTNGHFLSAQSGNSGGLTWAEVDLSSKMSKTGDTFTGDTTFYGGVINKILIWDASDQALEFWDGVKATFGFDADLQIVHDATDNQIKSTNGKIVVSTTAGNSDIEITPHGTGDVVIDGLKYPQADGTASQALTTNGSGQLSWSTVESTKAGGAIYENSNTISETHTLTANTNGMSAGPITVNSGVTLTIPSGATYTVI